MNPKQKKRQWTPPLRAAKFQDRRTKRLKTRSARNKKAINEQ